MSSTVVVMNNESVDALSACLQALNYLAVAQQMASMCFDAPSWSCMGAYRDEQKKSDVHAENVLERCAAADSTFQ